jgi:hypothetical protein
MLKYMNQKGKNAKYDISDLIRTKNKYFYD